MTCTCGECGELFKVDINVSDEVWETIRPSNSKPHGGLLCGKCIITALERKNEYGAFTLIKTP